MAKNLGIVRLIILGNENGPTSAKFSYNVYDSDDSDLNKSAILVVTEPSFDTQDLEAFYDGYVAEIKSLEGIS